MTSADGQLTAQPAERAGLLVTAQGRASADIVAGALLPAR